MLRLESLQFVGWSVWKRTQMKCQGGGDTLLQRLQFNNDAGFGSSNDRLAETNLMWRLREGCCSPSLGLCRASKLRPKRQISWFWCDYSCEMFCVTVYTHPNQQLLRWRDGSSATSGGWNLQAPLARPCFLILLLCLLLNSCSVTLLYANFGSCD